MRTVRIELPEALIEAAQIDPARASVLVAQLLALELFRADKVSLGRAAELCATPVEAFLVFAARREVPLHYGPSELEEDRVTLARLGLD